MNEKLDFLSYRVKEDPTNLKDRLEYTKLCYRLSVEPTSWLAWLKDTFDHTLEWFNPTLIVYIDKTINFSYLSNIFMPHIESLFIIVNNDFETSGIGDLKLPNLKSIAFKGKIKRLCLRDFNLAELPELVSIDFRNCRSLSHITNTESLVQGNLVNLSEVLISSRMDFKDRHTNETLNRIVFDSYDLLSKNIPHRQYPVNLRPGVTISIK